MYHITNKHLNLKSLLILPVLFLFTDKVFSQSGYTPPYGYVQSTPPSPESAKLAQFSISPPNLYNGTQSLGVPLYSFEFEGKNISLDLRYQASGVRVGENSGNVGLGWAISPPGSISRTIKGYDDLAFASNRDVVGYVYDLVPVPASYSHSYWVNYLNTGMKDTEPDIFSYSFLGSSGQFILNKKASSAAPITITKLTVNTDKILYDEPTKTFTVIDSDGFKGVFSVKEYSTAISGSNNNIAWDACSPQYVDVNQNIKSGGRAINSWHLEKIISPNERELVFNYDINPSNGFSDYLSINSESWGETNSIRSSFMTPSVVKSCSRVIYENIYLTSIQSLDHNIKIQFNYGEREDIENFANTASIYPNWLSAINTDRGGYSATLKSPKKLNSITVSNINSPLFLNIPIVFNQSYFNSTNPAKTKFWRLKLDNVIVGDQKYEFKYFDGLPAKDSRGIDYWGFYNGKDSNTYLAPALQTYPNIGINYFPYLTDNYYYQAENRSADFSFGKAGLLYEVKYPTGGKSVYEYESHEYKLDGREVTPATSAFNFISAINGNQNLDVFYKGFGIQGCGEMKITLRVECKDFYLGNPCTIASEDRTKLALELIHPAGHVMHSLRFDQLWGPGISNYEQVIIYNTPPGLPQGEYTMKTYAVQQNGATKYYGTIMIQFSSYCTQSSSIIDITRTQAAGGARVKSSAIFDESGNLIEKRKYEYTDNFGLSTGKLMNPLLQLTQFEGKYPSLKYFNTSGSALANGNAAQGSHIGYTEVKVIHEGKNGTPNGYEKYTYINKPNVYLPFHSDSTIGTHISTYAEENGSMEFKSNNNSTGNMVDYTIDKYQYVKTGDINAAQLFYFPNDVGTGYGPPASNFYKTRTGMMQLKSHTYSKPLLETTDSIKYNNFNQIKSVKKVLGDPLGETITHYKYPLDESTTSGIIGALKERNMVSIPYETQVTSNGTTIDAKGVLHKTISIGGGLTKVVPGRMFQHNTELGFSSSNGASFGGSYYETKNFVQYMANGNPTEFLDQGQIRKSIIWGYNGIYPIAIVDNAAANQICYTSFEAEEKGGWTFSGTPVTSAISKTGRKYYNLANGTISKSGLPSGTYKLTFWARVGSGTLNWNFMGKTENLTTTWKLVVREFTGTSTSIPMGNLYIDELRLHPMNSLMVSSTYDQMIGATSVTDPNNKTTIYEYDSFGRLLRVKDQDGFILEQYQYSYANSN